MNQIITFPSTLVKCKKCGAKYIYKPGSCTYPISTLIPLSIKGWIVTFKNLIKSDKNEQEEKEKKEEKNSITIISFNILSKGKSSSFFTCPICGGEIEKPWYYKPKSK